MDPASLFLKQCQSEGCRSTTLTAGPYCMGCMAHQRHETSKNADTRHSPSQGRPPVRTSKNGSAARILGEAITVRTSVPVNTPVNEKKQLSEKHVARKTTSRATQNQGPSHNPDSPASIRSTATDSSSMASRPTKRQRLTSSSNQPELPTRPDSVSALNDSQRLPDEDKVKSSEDSPYKMDAADQFALRPMPKTFPEIQSKATQNDDQQRIPIPSKERPPKVPSRRIFIADSNVRRPSPARLNKKTLVIDLTADDEDDPPSQNHGYPSPAQPGLTHSPANHALKLDQQSRKASPLSLQEKYDRDRALVDANPKGPPLGHFKSFTKRHEEILQQTNSVDFVLDAHGTSNPIVSKGNAQPKGKEAPKARENDPQQPRVISVNNGLDAVRRDTPDQPVSSGAKVAIEPPLDGMDITQDAIPATQNLGSLNAVSKPAGPDKTNGFFMDPKAPRLGFSSDPVPEVNGGSHSTARFATPTSPPRAQRQNHANQAPPVTDAEPLPTVNGVHEENGWQTSSKPPNAEPAAPPPASAPVPEQPRKRYQDPEAKRQALIAEHDPAEFDAYIYGELNRANRPGDALFALRPYARPTPSNDHIRPTTHFAAMDPRIHYAQPHSEAWHRAKHDEIAARGNRKSKTNFGKAAARRARRKREVAAHGDDDGASGGACDVPDHVRRDRKWVSALDELDEMADVTHAKQRAKIRRRKKGKGVEKGKEKGHERGKGPEKEKRKRTESDEDYDEMDTDADADSESDWSRTRRE